MALATFGGDEVNALVLDVGSSWTRAGYAGEDAPKALFPTYVGCRDYPTEAPTSRVGEGNEMDVDQPAPPTTKTKYSLGDGSVLTWRDGMEIRNPLKNGLVDDYDLLERVWDHAFRTALRVDPKEHPLLISEPSFVTREMRNKLAELAIEKFGFPAIYLCKSAVLTAFASGRPTALVVDMGAGTSSVTPVWDGYAVKKAAHHNTLAGDELTRQSTHLLVNSPTPLLQGPIRPRFEIAARKPALAGKAAEVVPRIFNGVVTDSFRNFGVQKIVEDWKETTCQVAEAAYNEAVLATRLVKTYEFPDGSTVPFGVERYRVPEILFNPSMAATALDEGASSSVTSLVHRALSDVDGEMRATLASSIVLSGGTSAFAGLSERFAQEASFLTPTLKIRVTAPTTGIADRKFSSWVGGSILASLGTFHTLWVSKSEWEEGGVGTIERRCQ